MTDDFLSSSRPPAASFKNIGDTVVGIVTAPPEKIQVRDFDTGQPATWPDGNPKMQWVVILQTELREGDGDDGLRTLYMPTWKSMYRATADAVRKAGSRTIEVGAKLGERWEGEGEQQRRGFNAPKVFSARYQAPEPHELDDFLTPADQEDLAATPAPPTNGAPARRPVVAAPQPSEIPF